MKERVWFGGDVLSEDICITIFLIVIAFACYSWTGTHGSKAHQDGLLLIKGSKTDSSMNSYTGRGEGFA